MFVLTLYKHKIKALLKRGYNPFEKNAELFQKEQEIKAKKFTAPTSEEQVAELPQDVATNQKTIMEAFEFALSIKSKTVNERTSKDYKYKYLNFIDWLKKEHPAIVTIDQLQRNVLQQYLNSILQRTSARNRNNFRADLNSLLQVLEDNEIIQTNIAKNITILRSKPERNKTYSKDVQEEIFEYLEKKDPILLLYIKFISYNFLRPIEVNRLKVGDLDLKQKTISFKAKNKAFKTKIIPDILLDDLPDLSKMNKDHLLFTPEVIGGLWEAEENNRRSYFTNRYKKVVKLHFNLDKNYGLYSFRHTFITKLYRAMVKDGSPYEAKSRLMQITGHLTMDALEKYLRDIDAELPEDYSALFKAT